MKSDVFWLTAAIVAALLAVSCGRAIPVVPETSQAARASIDRLFVLNKSLKDFKGIGRMKLIHSDRVESARMAWAGTYPNKLRMDIMGTPGVPLATLASDGQWVYLRLNQENRFYKKNNQAALFKRMVDIPISVREVAQILGGKVPVSPHQSAILIDFGDEHTLELRDGRGNVCQRIFFNSKKNSPVGFEIVKTNGAVIYRAEFLEMMNLEDYRVPKYLVLSNSKGERFELNVERYWVNQPLPSSRYVLQPPQ